MVQPNRPAGAHRRGHPLSHAEFEGRVEWECTRAEATGGTFSVARLPIPQEAPADASSLRPIDVVGLFGPGEYEVLLPGLAGDIARPLVAAFAQRLGGTGRVGIASYPDDGRHAAALLARAGARARGPVGDSDRRGLDVAEPVVCVEESMRRVQALAERAAAGDINVLILGETGVGKEVLARAIHARVAARRASRWSSLNCAALSRVAARERAVRARARRVHRRRCERKPGLARDRADGGTRVPRRDRRDAAGAAGQAAARDRDARGAARRRRARRGRSTCASSPRPTAISRRRSARRASGATSTSG